MIERVLKGREGLLMEFLPTPQELLDTVSGSMPHGPERDAHKAQMALNFEKYGAKDWYDWNTANWGTKWDFALDCVENPDPNTVTASFDSAWSPPIEAYNKLMELGFEIEAFYYEPGMQFVGKVWGDADGFDDQCIEYGGATADTVRDMIGEELDDYFAISEQMADWEEENQE
jgi:hypothetical protein